MSYTTYQAKNGVGVKGCFAGSMIFDGLGSQLLKGVGPGDPGPHGPTHF